MADPVKILAFAGSTRTDSFNKRLVRIAAGGARAAGAEVTLIDLRDFPMPLYDGDLEAADGLPAGATRLRGLMLGHGGFLIASPEYNSGMSAVLKNAIDWVSRPVGDEPKLAPFTGKVAAIMAASGGHLAPLRGLVHLRMILGNIGTIVLPGQLGIPFAGEAFGDDGNLKDAPQQAAAETLGENVAKILAKLG
jgi:NAD(P)H-dependent FMN reductase